KHAAQTAQARVREIRARIDINTLAHQPAAELSLNEIGFVSLESQRPLFFDPYRRNRATGAFILIDSITNETLGAGMIQQAHMDTGRAGRVSDAERQASRGHAAMAIAIEGDSEVAFALERRLFEHGCAVHVIERPRDLAQAVETALAAGLVAIGPLTSLSDGQVLRNMGASRLAEYRTAPGTAHDAAKLIWLDLQEKQILVPQTENLTGGEGI